MPDDKNTASMPRNSSRFDLRESEELIVDTPVRLKN